MCLEADLTLELYGLEVARNMKRKERYIARLEEVTITREGDYAFIE
jgi:hypothetical protein